MKDLQNYTDEELISELANRKQLKKDAPEQIELDKIDWSSVIRLANDRVDGVVKERRVDEDSENYIMEEVMKAVYGRSYFDWENKLG